MTPHRLRNNSSSKISRQVKPRGSSRLASSVKSKISVKLRLPHSKSLLVPGVVILVVFVVFAVGLWLFVQNISFTGREFAKLKNWQGDHNLNVLFIGVNDDDANMRVSTLQLSYLRPQEKKMSLLAINPDLGVVRGEGKILSYRVLLPQLISEQNLASAQTSTGESTDSDSKNKYAAISEFIYLLETDLGIKIDRYVLMQKSVKNNYLGSFAPAMSGSANGNVDISTNTLERLRSQNDLAKRYITEFSSVIKSPLYLGVLPFLAEEKGIATNFSTPELLRLLEVFRSIPSYSISEQITSDDLAYIREGILILDRTKFDNSLKKSYTDVQVQIEQGRVDVINGSGRSGLASKVRRLLTNYGYNIVKVGNTTEVLARNTLYVASPQDFPQTIEALMRLFPDLDVRYEDYPNRPTGDMVLVVI